MAARLIDAAEARKELVKQLEWLNLFAPELRDVILQYWQALLALLPTFAAFAVLGKPAKYISERLFVAESKFVSMPETKSTFERGGRAELTDEYRFNFAKRELTLVGRTDEVERLKQFLDQSTTFSWWWVNGITGIGKSRIVLDWLLQLRRRLLFFPPRYVAGFYVDTVGQDFWLKWQPRRSTVIAIDNAAEKSKAVLNLLRVLGERAQDLKHPVRVLLIEGNIPKSLSALDEEQQYARHRFQVEPLTLRPLTADSLKVLASELASKRGKQLALDEQLSEQILELSEGSPLIIHMALDNLLEYGELRWASKDSLLKNQVQFMVGRYKTLGVDPACLPLLALATFTRGLPWDVASSFQGSKPRPDKRLLDKVFHQDTARQIPPIKPDLFGEYFLLAEYGNMPEPDRDAFRNTAWQVNPENVALSLSNLFRDVPYRLDDLATLDEPPTGIASAAWGAVHVWFLKRSPSSTQDNLFQYHLKALQSWASPQKDSPVAQYIFTMGLAAVIATHVEEEQIDQASNVLQELRGIATGFPDMAEIQAHLAEGTLPLLHTACQGHQRIEVQPTYEELRKIAAQFPGVEEIQLTSIRGSSLMLNFYAQSKAWNEVEHLLQVITDVAQRFPSYTPIQEVFAGNLMSLISEYCDTQQCEKAERHIHTLRELALRFPQEEFIVSRFVGGLLNGLSCFSDQQRWSQIAQMFDAVEQITADNSGSPWVQLVVQSFIAQIIGYYGDKGQWDEMNEAIILLKKIAQRFPENAEMQTLLAVGAYHAIRRYGAHSRLSEMQEMFALLTRLADSFPKEDFIQQIRAQGAAHLIASLGNSQRWDEVQVALTTLENMTRRYPNNLELKLQLAQSTLNLTQDYLKHQRWPDVSRMLALAQKLSAGLLEKSDFQSRFAMTQAFSLLRFAEHQQWGALEKTAQDLRTMAARHPDNIEIQRALALGMLSSLPGCVSHKRWKEMESAFQTIHNVALQFPSDSALQEHKKEALEYYEHGLQFWGDTLLNKALASKWSPNARRLCRLAAEKYSAVNKLNPTNSEALNQWGVALMQLASQSKTGVAYKLYEQAEQKLTAALAAKPDDALALNNLGYSLMQRAKTETGDQAQQHLNEAENTLKQAESILVGVGAYNLACLAALRTEEDSCKAWLNKSLEAGMLPTRRHIMKDCDLKVFRNRDWFKAFIANIS